MPTTILGKTSGERGTPTRECSSSSLCGEYALRGRGDPLSEGMKRVVRRSIPAAAILLPAAFFQSVASPDATKPNALIYLA